MEEALFGLVGVVVGGVIASLGPYLLVARAERRRARAAARLLEAELRTIASHLELPARIRALDVSRHGRDQDALWVHVATALPAAELWEAHRAALAEVLRPGDSCALSRAYEAIAALRHNRLHTITAKVIDAARETLVIGQP